MSGVVQSGVGDASRWLTEYSDAYREKLGLRLYPGSLNLCLEAPFDWADPDLTDSLVDFPGDEMGGERDVLLLPAVLVLSSRVAGYLWTTTIGAVSRDDLRVVEFVTDVYLRGEFGLSDGDRVTVQLSGDDA